MSLTALMSAILCTAVPLMYICTSFYAAVHVGGDIIAAVRHAGSFGRREGLLRCCAAYM